MWGLVPDASQPAAWPALTRPRNPLAVAFVVHMRAFMVLWLITLPITLVESMGWTTIAVCFVVAFATLGIDAMAGRPFALTLPRRSLVLSADHLLGCGRLSLRRPFCIFPV